MEIHDRFMKLPTTGINVVKTLAGNCNKESSIIDELVETYNKKIFNDVDLKTLEEFRMILCYKYQTLVNSCKREDPLECTGRSYMNLRNFFINNNEYRSREEFSVLYDIVVLQLVFNHKQLLMISFKDFCECQELSSSKNIELAMAVSECFVDSYNLHTYLYKSVDNSTELEEHSTRILMIIQSWMKQEDIQWELLTLLLPKLIITFDPRKIISSLWHRVIGSLYIVPSNKRINDIIDLDKKLVALCVMADVCFPSEKEKIQNFHYEQCVQHEFWWILNRGLISTVFQQRKQALYLVKRAVEFVESHKTEINQLKPLIESGVPFLCIKSNSQGSSLAEIKKNFYLILEALEEKQKHLVLPALTQLPSLVKDLRNSFNPIWLCCLFRRIVEHDDDSIKIIGLQEILNSDPYIFFDDETLYMFVNVLKNNNMYECNVDEEKPPIVKKLEECLLKWEEGKINLINSFVRALSSVLWGPVAIYWVLEALLAVSKQCKIVTNVWGLDEMLSMDTLIRMNLLMHTPELRTYSQVLISRIFRAYVSMPVDPSALECMFYILFLFPENEVLRPNSEEWLQITDHLKTIIEPSDAMKYVTQKCKKLFTTEQSLKSFALTIVILLDSELIFIAKPCAAKKALENLFESLVDADQRPDVDRAALLKVFEFSGHLMNAVFRAKPLTAKKMNIFLSPYIDKIIKILARIVSLGGPTNPAYDEYLLVVSGLLSTWQNPLNYLNSEFYTWPDLDKNLEQLEDKCIYIITNPQKFCRTQWSYAINVLDLAYPHMWFKRINLQTVYVPALLSFFISESKDHEENAADENEVSKGKFVSDCSKIVATIVHKSIVDSPLEARPPNINWFEDLLALVKIGKERVIEQVIGTLYELLKERSSLSTKDVNCIHSALRVSWQIVFQLKKTPQFFSTLTELTHVIVSESFLKTDGAREFAIECVDQMMREGESVPLLKRIFVDSLESWHIVTPDRFHQVLTSCLLHGAVSRRDQRIERAAFLHGLTFYNDESLQSILDMNIDTAVRAQAIIRLICIIKSSSETSQIRGNILKDILEILEQNKNKKHFENSQLHRLKHRAMQTLLLLEPLLNKTETKCLYDALSDFLIAESNQTSVRLMQEWLLIRLYLKNEDLEEKIWTLFETTAEQRPVNIVSLASVVFHVARSLPEQKQRKYIAKAISRLLSNCMSQQFNSRLYSQTILVKIYEMLPKNSSEAKTYKDISNSVENSLRHGNLMKNSAKVLDDFYFKIFDPILDYNLETIYYELPRLTNVSTDEWITPSMLKDCSGVQVINNERGALRTAKPSPQSSKATGELVEHTDPSTDGGLSDIQKKIIPCKTMVPFCDDLSEILKAKLLRRKMENAQSGIIVVASLIDRPPNLGGLARTCDIFETKELVIGNLKHVKDREFQTFSESAEKWITITEVKPHILQNYLLEKKSEGWQLVGAEQTAKSTNLREMEFSRKTILLLGNEKDGIPANLIPLLDTCVEIPQNGVVRSLNVHVTGAICIWQYAKQHVLS